MGYRIRYNGVRTMDGYVKHSELKPRATGTQS